MLASFNMRQARLILIAVFLMSYLLSPGLQAGRIREYAQAYAGMVSILSFVGTLPMIVIYEGLKKADKSCQNCKKISDLKRPALVSIVAPPVTLGMTLFLSYIAGQKPGDLPNREDQMAAGSCLGVFLFAGILVSHISALYTDISVWKTWPELEDLIQEEHHKGLILGGSIVSGMLHWAAYPLALASAAHARFAKES